ncbi:MAG TPA: isoprenylcysteine carboxylmethyltransferase family protein [Terriglobales bacterium]|jgi:protein-S-isoprenylcysteine O-methyltransferase Ste14|nr:isoprenylcysteine carboxylmethyltransferase family protein [Terriglobales bacterium]
MVGKNIVLTLVVAAAAACLGWEKAPAAWTPLRIFGLCLATAAFVLWSAARFQLGNSLTVSAQARQLVTRGLYAKIRNPIYVFGSLFIAGYILLLDRPRWLLMFLVIIPLQLWRAGKEARVLEATFGEAYRAYRARTWM